MSQSSLENRHRPSWIGSRPRFRWWHWPAGRSVQCPAQFFDFIFFSQTNQLSFLNSMVSVVIAVLRLCCRNGGYTSQQQKRPRECRHHFSWGDCLILKLQVFQLTFVAQHKSKKMNHVKHNWWTWRQKLADICNKREQQRWSDGAMATRNGCTSKASLAVGMEVDFLDKATLKSACVDVTVK